MDSRPEGAPRDLIPSVSLIVPTVLLSPWLGEALRALRAAGSRASQPVEILLVNQAREPIDPELVRETAATVLDLRENRGFAGGVNAGIAASRAEFIGVVNDDVLVDPDWLVQLLDLFADRPRAGAAQGINLSADRTVVDGAGIGWNRWWQATQIDRGGAPPDPGGPPRPVFGVSATAALYRRSALERSRLDGGLVFDSGLESYYEDVDLACRLAARGFTAWSLPGARTRHRGSSSAGIYGARRARLLYRNRHLVLARALGRRYFPALPRLLVRDLLDLATTAERPRALDLAAAWWAAARTLPRYASLRPSELSTSQLATAVEPALAR